MSHAHAQHPQRESGLLPEDFDRALRRLKDDLALKALRRRLLDPGLDAAEVLAVTRRIEEIQRRIRAARQRRILHPIALNLVLM